MISGCASWKLPCYSQREFEILEMRKVIRTTKVAKQMEQEHGENGQGKGTKPIYDLLEFYFIPMHKRY
jgi:hypothetical protein